MEDVYLRTVRIGLMENALYAKLDSKDKTINVSKSVNNSLNACDK
jgi:hypothetical protein